MSRTGGLPEGEGRALLALRTGRILGRLSPRWLLIFWLAIAIIGGTLLLKLPFALPPGRVLSWPDALFTATSSICVTGLTVVDTSDFTLFGQLVILALIQIGGLGIMTLATFLLLLLGRRVGFRQRTALRETIADLPSSNVRAVLWSIVKFIFITETVGAVVFFIRFLPRFWGQPGQSASTAIAKTLYFAVFHAISGFCNAGFSPFRDSLAGFRPDPFVNGMMMVLIIAGGLGFPVIHDVVKAYQARPLRRVRPLLNMHTRIVLLTSAALVVGGTGVFYLLELRHTGHDVSVATGLTSALFLSVTSRTAGFYTVPPKELADATKLIVIFLMFVGASPGSCGGGIKTSTFAVAVALIFSRLCGREHTQVGHRSVPDDIAIKALGTITACFLLVVVVSLALMISEDSPDGGTPRFIDVLFETVSAFGTVGLSTGITPGLSTVGKLLITFTMFAGKMGPLTLIMAFSTQASALKFKYPEEHVMIG